MGLENGQTYYMIVSDDLPTDTFRLSPTRPGALSSDGTSNLVRFHLGSLAPGGTHYLGIEGLGLTQPGADLLAGSNATFDPGDLDGQDGFAVSGVDAGNQAGAAVTGVGDIDGDGFDDFVIGGATPYLMYGFHDPGSGDYSLDDPRVATVPIMVGGDVIGRVGDLNGDGFDDLVIGDPMADNGAGAISIIFGAAERFADSITRPNAVVYGQQAGDHFGASLTGVDLNNDSYADLVVGAPDAQGGQGQVYVLFGYSMPAGLGGSYYNTPALANAESAIGYITSRNPDATFIATELDYPNNSDVINDANSLSTYLGRDAASLTGTDAASLEGSVFTYEGHLYVPTAGTYEFRLGADDGARLVINGDVVIDKLQGGFNTVTKSYTFDRAGMHTLSVLHFEDGGGTGVRLDTDLGGSLQPLALDFLLSSSWDLGALDGKNGFVILGDTDAELGAAVSAAGDFNDDTYADVILGAPGADEAYVLYGSTGAYAQTLTHNDFTGRGSGVTLHGPAGGQAGFAVDGAGDVNGDGIDDVVLGAPAVGDHAGQSYIVFGSGQAFPSSVDLSQLDGGDGLILNGISAGDSSGVAVAGPGDIDGDGFADVLIGVPGVGVLGQSQAGSVYLVLGAADIGDMSGRDFQTLGDRALAIIGQEAGAQLGTAVGGLGDLNGDGAPDLALGALSMDGDRGRAYALFGVDPNAVHYLVHDLVGDGSGGTQKFEQSSSLLSPAPLSGRPEVIAWGAAGALIGGEGAVATANVKPVVRAFIGIPPGGPDPAVPAEVIAGDEVYVQAFSAIDIKAEANGYLITLVGGGGGAAKTDITLAAQAGEVPVMAYISRNANITAQGGDLTVLAESHDTVNTTATAISDGLIAELQARALQTLERLTEAAIGVGAVIDAEGDVNVTALKSTGLTAAAKGGGLGSVVVPTAIVNATVGVEGVPTVYAQIDKDAKIASRGAHGVVVSATNSPEDEYRLTATSDSYGGVTGQKAEFHADSERVRSDMDQGDI